MWYPANPYIILGYTFAWGEIGADLSDVTLDGQDPDDLDWVINWAVFKGTAAQNPWATWGTIIPALAGKPRHTGEVFLAVMGYRYALPNIPTAKAKMTQGRLVTDFRTAATNAGGGNPALYAYNILTDAELGLAIPTASVDAGVGGSWRTGADHYDEDPGDGSTRYAFHGAISRRDPYLAASEILNHGGYSELVYFEHLYRLRTRQCVVPRADVAIGAGDWIQDPKVGFVKDAPNQVIVKYQTPDGTPGSAQPDYAAFVAAEDAVPEEITLSGCVTQGHAKRMATKRYNCHVLENIMAKGYVPRALVADVVKGDIIPVTEPQLLLDETPCWVEELREDGIQAYVELLRYDDDTDSDVVAVDDDPLWDLDPPGIPVPPATCTQTLLLIGPWEANTLLPDADDLTASGWVDDGGHDVAYNGGGDYSTLACDSAAPGDFYAVIDPGTAAQVLLTLCIALHQAGDVTDPYNVFVRYQSRPTAGAWTNRGSRQLYPNASVGRFLPWVGAIDVYQADDEHRIVLEVPPLDGGATATAVRLKRLFVLPWSENPEERPPGIDLRERWTWVEGAGADTTVEGYRLVRKRFANPSQWEVVGQVPRPETSLEVSALFIAPGSGGGGPGSGGGGEGPDPSLVPIMTFPITLVARGLNGQTVDAPDPTQTFRGSLAPTAPSNVTLAYRRNHDHSTTNSDKVDQWDTNGSVTFDTDVETAPDGDANADAIEAGSSGQAQNLDAFVPDWVMDRVTGYYYGLVWMKVASGSEEIELRNSAVEFKTKTVLVRDHWRLFRMPLTTIENDTGPKIAVDSLPQDLYVCGGLPWPQDEDLNHRYYFLMEWSAFDDERVDGYELQYRTRNAQTGLISRWQTHITKGPTASSISWGDHPTADGPSLPHDKNSGPTGEQLYDWRVVVVRGGLYTELVPGTVTEESILIGGRLQQQEDVDITAGLSDGDALLWDTGDEKFKPGGVTDFGADYLHGFENRTDSTLAFDKDEHILTIGEATPSVWFAYWYKGARVLIPETTIDFDEVVELSEGIWYVYFEDASGVPVASQTPWDLLEHVPICTVFWNGSGAAIGDERHGYRRDLQWHAWAHMTVGTRYQSGLEITAPSTGSYSTIDFSAGTLWDEDIQLTIAQQTNCRIFYLTDASTYTWEASTRAHLWSGSAIQYIDTDTYAKTALSGGQRINTWIYGSNDTAYPLYVVVEARSAPHSTTAQAREITPPDLAALGLTPELKLLYRCIWGATSLEEVTDYRNAASLPAGGSSQTAATNVTFAPAGNIAATNVQAALEELDTEKQAAGNYLEYRATGTKSGFNLTGTAFTIADWAIPSGQQHDGGEVHIEVGVTDATDNKAQALTSRWIWQIARKGAAPAITVYQLGTPAPADPDSGTLTVALDVSSLGTVKVAVTSSISGGSAPVGGLTWRMTGEGVAVITPA
jgi:hypothetical protein